jgi:hypothetical protein
LCFAAAAAAAVPTFGAQPFAGQVGLHFSTPSSPSMAQTPSVPLFGAAAAPVPSAVVAAAPAATGSVFGGGRIGGMSPAAAAVSTSLATVVAAAPSGNGLLMGRGGGGDAPPVGNGTSEGSLPADELAAFRADAFVFGRIPQAEPPPELR